MMRSAKPRREAFPSRLRGDRGDVAASLIILVAVIAFILIAVHLAFVFHGRHVAAAAAQDGLHAAQAYKATEGDGVDAANKTLDFFAGLKARDVKVNKTDELVTVSIEAEVSGLVNGLLTNLSVRVEGPPEDFNFEGDRK